MIRYLNQEEIFKAQKMYQENFSEDSKEFVEYYFSWKTNDNKILVMEEEELEVMIHLNPYKFFFCGNEISVNYIVAVATDPKVRRQGKMKQVLMHALEDMKMQQQPFTFLLPAVDPNVYTSCDFSFVKNENYDGYRALFTEMERQLDAFVNSVLHFRH